MKRKRVTKFFFTLQLTPRLYETYLPTTRLLLHTRTGVEKQHTHKCQSYSRTLEAHRESEADSQDPQSSLLL